LHGYVKPSYKDKIKNLLFINEPFSLWEKVAEGRMRGGLRMHVQQLPLTLTLSLRERGQFILPILVN